MNLCIPLGRVFLGRCEEPIPLQRIVLLRRLSVGRDALFPRHGGLRSFGASLRNPVLAEKLRDVELGIWTLGADTLNFVEKCIRMTRPRCVLEFSSGISTLCLAQYMLENGKTSDVSPQVISIEQSAAAAESTADLVAKNGLADRVRVFYAPLEPREIEGRVMNCYSLDRELISLIAQVRPDFVLIDGPFAEPGARFGTIPLVRSHLAPGSRFLLDDALRDGEIDAARRWARLNGVTVEGVIPLDKGILSGCIDTSS